MVHPKTFFFITIQLWCSVWQPQNASLHMVRNKWRLTISGLRIQQVYHSRTLNWWHISQVCFYNSPVISERSVATSGHTPCKALHLGMSMAVVAHSSSTRTTYTGTGARQRTSRRAAVCPCGVQPNGWPAPYRTPPSLRTRLKAHTTPNKSRSRWQPAKTAPAAFPHRLAHPKTLVISNHRVIWT
jgi:hypothetical protein